MKPSSRVVCALIISACPLVMRAANEKRNPDLPANDPVRIELDIIANAQQAAQSGDESAADSQLNAATSLNSTPSVLLARRAMTVCGRLQNDNEYAKATKLAQRTLKRLAGMKENNDADRGERLYWEALLEGRILDHKAIAVALLEEAAALSPDDERVLDLKRDFAASLAHAGR